MPVVDTQFFLHMIPAPGLSTNLVADCRIQLVPQETLTAGHQLVRLVPEHLGDRIVGIQHPPVPSAHDHDALAGLAQHRIQQTGHALPLDPFTDVAHQKNQQGLLLRHAEGDQTPFIDTLDRATLERELDGPLRIASQSRLDCGQDGLCSLCRKHFAQGLSNQTGRGNGWRSQGFQATALSIQNEQVVGNGLQHRMQTGAQLLLLALVQIRHLLGGDTQRPFHEVAFGIRLFIGRGYALEQLPPKSPWPVAYPVPARAA